MRSFRFFRHRRWRSKNVFRQEKQKQIFVRLVFFFCLQIDKLVLGHESVDGESGWFVQSVSIEIPSKNVRSETFFIKKFLNSKRSDGIPLVEVQVRKPMKNSSRRIERENLQNQKSKISVMSIDAIRSTEFLYEIFILTEDFRSSMKNPKIFVDFRLGSNFVRLNGDENETKLRRDVLTVFRAYGSRLDQVQIFIKYLSKR